jgi:hypothetical protein
VKWDRDAALDPANLQPAHYLCNNRKQDKPARRARPVVIVRREPSIEQR